MFGTRRWAGAGGVVMVLAAAATWAQGPRFVGIGQFAGGGSTQATSVSDDGSVVTGWGYTAANARRAVVWTADGGLHTLVGPAGQETIAYGVSGDGSAVVGAYSAVGMSPFRSPQPGPIQPLQRVEPNFGYNEAFDANHDGSVIVGWAVVGQESYAARWTASGVETLPRLSGMSSAEAVGVSDNGVIVGRCISSTSASWACRWVGGSVQQIGLSNQAVPEAISNNGSVIVGESAGGSREASRWTAAGGWVGLGSLPGTNYFSGAYDTNYDGSIIVGQVSTGTQEQGFVWTQPLGMVSLRQYLTMNGVIGFDGWTLREAQGISADGHTIVGYGTNPAGVTEGFVATVPAPAGLIMAPLVLVLSLRRTRV